jgi:hypothetical protein
MKAILLFLSVLLGSLCVGNSWAQVQFTTDGRLFTVTPQPIVMVTPQTATNVNSIQVASATDQVPAEAKKPVVLNFDKLPERPWVVDNCYPGNSAATTSHGVLTINSLASGCFEYMLFDPEGIWHKYVSNQRGWVVETSLRMDPSTTPVPFDGAVITWINDHSNLIIVGFNPNELLLTYPERVSFPMDTTNAFHIYRIESKGNRVRIYVDGHLAIDHMLTWAGGGTNVLTFGDGNVFTGATSLTQWDYFSYEVFPVPAVKF